MGKLVTNHHSGKLPANIGGKARNLLELNQLGIPTAPWVVIPQNILVELAGLTEGLSLQEAQNRVANCSVPADVLLEIDQFFGSEAAHKKYAVRSSAVDEDGVEHSFAGQFETHLNVPHPSLASAIEKIWQSAATERVFRYRTKRGLPLRWGIAVIIQEMLLPEVAGVAFGIDPVSGNRETKVISALYGIGEGLVSGDLDADTFTVTPGGIQKKIAKKEFAFVADTHVEGLQKKAVAENKQQAASLTDEQINVICAVINRLDTHFGKPQDVEFGICNQQLYILQTRPVTSAINTDDEYILWDNSNIVESYPGITTPLTFTFIIKMYASVYRSFASLLGVSNKQLDKHQDVFNNTLGLVRGRVYYNLLSWYKMLAMVPGYSINARFMENMMGVKERFELKGDFQLSKHSAWLRIAWMVVKLLWLQATLPAERRRFMKHLDAVMAHYSVLPFDAMTITEIQEHYASFEQTLLNKWKAPLINDFFAMIWFGLLQKLTEKYSHSTNPNLHNDLLCNSQDIISTEPIHQSIAIAQRIKGDADAQTLFMQSEPSEIWRQLEAGKYPEIKAKIDRYINTFGERCIGELKLETESISQNPLRFISTLKAYVEQDIVTGFREGGLEEDIRHKAEKELRSDLKGKPFKRWIFNLVLRKTREMVSSRENLRFERTRGFGMVRKMFTALGNKLYQGGLIKQSKDIFYLELDEVLALTNEPNQELVTRLYERKAAFEVYKAQPVPNERFYTYGHNFSDAFIYAADKLHPKENELKGIGCCPGIVEGLVKVVTDPHSTSHLNGEILVTSSTDPGWITLFPTASAIIVERGSLLSHSAIVSRELGIPCIVSVTGLLRTLKTGDRIRMDGSTGEIKIIANG